MSSFFKAYDMRGTFGVDFDLDTVFRVGRALPGVIAAQNGSPRGRNRILVGRDGRSTSPAVRDALVAGLAAAGAEVTDLGLVTTPIVYFHTASGDFDGSVMVTASHNPPTDNGLKVSRRGALPIGFANGLGDVERIVAGDSSKATEPPCVATLGDAAGRYAEWIESHSPLDDSIFNYAVDCSNGASALVAKRLFPNALIVNGAIDGGFPAHAPNPLLASARGDAVRIVRERKLDFAIVFDGDGDRAVFVDNRGEFVMPDSLVAVIARSTRRALGGGTGERVIHDVRTGRGVIETLREDGFEPVMVPVGHAFAKPALRRENAICGGELAAHYYFREFFGCDSGVFAARRVLGEFAIAKSQGRTFADMVSPIAGRYANSGELNFRVANAREAVDRAVTAAGRALPAEIGRSEIDGVRLEYEDGWVNVRASNTEPLVRLIVEARGGELVREWVDALSGAITA